jgi:hypothetical protein
MWPEQKRSGHIFLQFVSRRASSRCARTSHTSRGLRAQASAPFHVVNAST